MEKIENNHKIVIKTLKHNEIVTYSAIVIKGTVSNSNPNPKCQNNFITLSNIIYNLNNNKFKVLFELKFGQNLIELNYCCTSIKFTINYCPRDAPHSVLPLYIICDGHDGTFQAPKNHVNNAESACKRITLCSKLLQSVFAEKLNEANFGRKTFRLENECQIFYSKLHYSEARQLPQTELWEKLGREICNSSLGGGNRKFLAFLSCTWYYGEKLANKSNATHEDLLGVTEAYVALGGGGLALFGSHCLFSWPENVLEVANFFNNSEPIDKSILFDDSCYRNTFGACFSTTLGSVLHELCHTFDCGHTESGIMGRGFDNIWNFFTIKDSTMPKSGVSVSFRDTVEFREKLDSGRLSERNGERRKEFRVEKGGGDEEDHTFWTKSCSILLGYHKWFNNYPESNKILKYDSGNRVISSTAGLRVVELRKESDEMVVEFWVFEGRVLRYCFQLPDEALKTEQNLILVVEDNVGNIVKKLIVV